MITFIERKRGRILTGGDKIPGVNTVISQLLEEIYQVMENRWMEVR